MRIALLGLFIFFGTLIGMSAIDTVSNLQDTKMRRFCKSVPVGASYDDMCSQYRTSH